VVNLAIVGATGMVGSYFIKILQERGFAGGISFFASQRSAGKIVKFGGSDHVIKPLDESIVNEDIHIALFAAGGDISAKFAPMLAQKGVIVIDNSSHFRMDENVPLVVPEVNAAAAKAHKGIIANPNCSTIQAVVALAPLHEAFELKRVIYTTYQAVSGAGLEGWQDLEGGLKGEPNNFFAYPIANNVIPQIDVFKENGYTAEEMKMVNETRKILNAPDLAITATCVRIPIFNVHSICINAEFQNKFDIKEVVRILGNAPGVIVKDDPDNKIYPMPICADGTDEVFIGRIRRDDSVPNALNMWVVSDNLRKGAATNAIQIAQLFE
jgi:aspartate-semialdehyde dehydrogenase